MNAVGSSYDTSNEVHDTMVQIMIYLIKICIFDIIHLRNMHSYIPDSPLYHPPLQIAQRTPIVLHDKSLCQIRFHLQPNWTLVFNFIHMEKKKEVQVIKDPIKLALILDNINFLRNLVLSLKKGTPWGVGVSWKNTHPWKVH